MEWLNSAALMISKNLLVSLISTLFAVLDGEVSSRLIFFIVLLLILPVSFSKMQFWLNKNAKTWVRRGQKVGFVAEQVCGKQKGLINYSCSSSVVQGMSNIPHSILYKQSNDIQLLIEIYCRVYFFPSNCMLVPIRNHTSSVACK